jgi:hypothetical protein
LEGVGLLGKRGNLKLEWIQKLESIPQNACVDLIQSAGDGAFVCIQTRRMREVGMVNFVEAHDVAIN